MKSVVVPIDISTSCESGILNDISKYLINLLTTEEMDHIGNNLTTCNYKTLKFRPICQKLSHYFAAGIYLLKVNNETLEKGIKYVQS